MDLRKFVRIWCVIEDYREIKFKEVVCVDLFVFIILLLVTSIFFGIDLIPPLIIRKHKEKLVSDVITGECRDDFRSTVYNWDNSLKPECVIDGKEIEFVGKVYSDYKSDLSLLHFSKALTKEKFITKIDCIDFFWWTFRCYLKEESINHKKYNIYEYHSRNSENETNYTLTETGVTFYKLLYIASKRCMELDRVKKYCFNYPIQERTFDHYLDAINGGTITFITYRP